MITWEAAEYDMHLIHKWRFLGYEGHGFFGYGYVTGRWRCSQCGRNKLRIIRGMKPRDIPGRNPRR